MPAITLLKSETLYDGQVICVKRDRVIEPGGVRAVREVVEHSGSVVVLPQFPDGRILLVRQYRHPVRQYLWELVAGSIEKGESATRAARRELLEESGYKARMLKQILTFYSSPGFLTERMHLVLARGLTLTEARPEPDERIEARLFSWDQVTKLVRDKKIKDGKTLVGVLWLNWNRPRARPKRNNAD
jgi:ADP-ribose diphosphatase